MSSLVVPVSFENIYFDGHSEHLQSWVIESTPLIIFKVWMMSNLSYCILRLEDLTLSVCSCTVDLVLGVWPIVEFVQ